MVLTNTNKLTLNAMRFMKRVIALFLGNTVKNQNYFNVEHYYNFPFLDTEFPSNRTQDQVGTAHGVCIGFYESGNWGAPYVEYTSLGLIDGCFVLNGGRGFYNGEEYIQLSENIFKNKPTGYISILFKPLNLGGFIYGQSTSDGGATGLKITSEGAINWYLDNTSFEPGAKYISSNNVIELNNEYQFIVTWGDSQAAYYVNGVKVHSGTFTTSTPNNSGDSLIGKGWDGEVLASGFIDEFAVGSTFLTDEIVTWWFNNGKYRAGGFNNNQILKITNTLGQYIDTSIFDGFRFDNYPLNNILDFSNLQFIEEQRDIVINNNNDIPFSYASLNGSSSCLIAETSFYKYSTEETISRFFHIKWNSLSSGYFFGYTEHLPEYFPEGFAGTINSLYFKYDSSDNKLKFGQYIYGEGFEVTLDFIPEIGEWYQIVLGWSPIYIIINGVFYNFEQTISGMASTSGNNRYMAIGANLIDDATNSIDGATIEGFLNVDFGPIIEVYPPYSIGKLEQNFVDWVYNKGQFRPI